MIDRRGERGGGAPRYNRSVILTERVPEDQGQFGDLLSLLAKLQQRSLPGIFIQQVGNVLKCTAVVVRDDGLNGIILRVGGGGKGVHIVVCAGQTVVVLLLGNIGGGGSSLGMLMVRGLLVKPGRVGLGVLVVAVDMGILHHLGLCVRERKNAGDGAR